MDDGNGDVNQNGRPRLLRRQRVFVDVVGIRNFGDPTFKEHFRMRKDVFEKLVILIGNHLAAQGRLHRLRTAIDEALLMGLWILFNLDTFRSTGLQFNKDRSVVHFHYTVLIEALRELAPKFIKWPTALERQQTSVFYDRRFGFPGIVGSIDGSLFAITAPAVQKQKYVDGKKRYSINVQAVSDHRRLFRDLCVGHPGSVHDQRVFRRSPLSADLYSRGNVMMHDDEHLLGDGGYILSSKVPAPFINDGHLQQSRRHFNFVHSQSRISVERAFGLEKGKMQRLYRLYTKNLEYTLDHITSSFTVHNFIILDGDESDGITFQDPHPAVNFEQVIAAAQVAGQRKRNYISDLLERNLAL